LAFHVEEIGLVRTGVTITAGFADNAGDEAMRHGVDAGRQSRQYDVVVIKRGTLTPFGAKE